MPLVEYGVFVFVAQTAAIASVEIVMRVIFVTVI